MKILIVSDNFPPKLTAGAESVAFREAKSLVSMGYDVFVFTTTGDKREIGWAEFEGIKIFYFQSGYNERWRPYLSLFNPWVVFEFKKELEKLKPDAVHFHNVHFHFSYHCLKVAKSLGAKVFLTAHDVMLFHYDKLIEFINPEDLSCPEKFNYKISAWRQLKKAKKRYNPLRNIIISRYLNYADKIFAVSRALKEALEQNGIKNIDVIHNGIDADWWRVNKEELEKFKTKFKLGGKKIILFGGRLSFLKGSDAMMKAMEKISSRNPNAVLLVTGKEAKGFEKNEKLKNKIIFAGWLSGEDLKAAYHVSDLVVAPSVCFDSFPTVILEAMACKKPVVATCFGGAREMVQDNINGYIVNPYNTELMASKIINLLDNEKLADEMGEAGYGIAQRNFSLDNQIKKYLNYFIS